MWIFNWLFNLLHKEHVSSTMVTIQQFSLGLSDGGEGTCHDAEQDNYPQLPRL